MLQYYNNITKTLTIPCEFNEELKDIPNDTEIIIFDEDFKNYKYSKFNQEIKENVLPDSLHTLTFGSEFNQEIKENILPDSLHTLTFGDYFDQEIKENVLPNNLHTLTFGCCFNQEIIENVLPKSIKKISLWSHCNLINNLPLRIEEVCIKFYNVHTYNKEVNNLPITVKKITIDDEKYLKYITKIPFGCNIVIL
jgi:hypothetical protein